MATYRETIRDEHGEVIASACVTEPLSDEARAALAELVQFARKLQQQRDPENVLGDRQQRRIARLNKRKTRGCPSYGCDRIEGHGGRCMTAEEYAEVEARAMAKVAHERGLEAAARSGDGDRR